MPYFKDKTDAVHFLDDADFAHLLPDGCVEISDEEAAAIQKPTHAQAVPDAWGKIKEKREHVKAGGVKVGAKWFHTDDASRIQHMALNMMGTSIPANLQWKTMDGSFVVMTQALAGQVFQAVAVLDMQAFAKAEEHRIAMEASSDPASYDFSAGWPASFEG